MGKDKVMTLNISEHSIAVIYLLRNKLNDKVYVGSTKDLYRRWVYGYIYFAKKDFPPRRGIEMAIKHHGIKAFNLEILERVEDISKLGEREQFWINYYQPFGERGYNWAKHSNYKPKMGPQGKLILSEEQRQHRKNVATRNIPILLERCERAVYQIDKKTLEIVAEYESAIKADRALGLPPCSVNSVARKRPSKRQTGGFYWCYKDVYEVEGFTPPPKPKRSPRAVRQLSLDGNYITIWENVKLAAQSVKTSSTSIRSCCKNKRFSCQNYRWEFVEQR